MTDRPVILMVERCHAQFIRDTGDYCPHATDGRYGDYVGWHRCDQPDVKHIVPHRCLCGAEVPALTFDRTP